MFSGKKMEENVLRAFEELILSSSDENKIDSEKFEDIVVKNELSFADIDYLINELNNNGFSIDEKTKMALLDSNFMELKGTRERIICAKVARISLSKSYLDSDVGYREYVKRKYALKRSQANDFRRIGLRFIKKDEDGLPNLRGETIFKELYGFDEDFNSTQLRELLVLTDDEIDGIIKDYGITPEVKIKDLKHIIEKVHVKKSGNDQKTVDRMITNKIEYYNSLPVEIKDKIFETEVMQRYGVTLNELEAILSRK